MNDYLGKRQLDRYSHSHLLRWLNDQFQDADGWCDAYDAILTLIEDSDESIETMTHRGWTRLYLDAMEVSHG